VLTLSHWPGSPTPPPLARDLSTEIALAYLDDPSYRVEAEFVTSDHLDEDGLAALFVLVNPEIARSSAELLVEVARVGDFGIVRDERAALVAFALAAWFDPGRSPEPVADPGTSWTAHCYDRLLRRLPELLERPERARDLAAPELDHFVHDRDAIARGVVALTEFPRSDLAVVTMPTDVDPDGLEGPSGFGLHRAAIHSATAAVRVLLVAGRRYRYYDRYETWVNYVSRPLPGRRDLGPLARRLTEEERGTAQWVADGPGTLVAGLGVADGDESSLTPDHVRRAIESYLGRAPVAWAPASPTGPLVPIELSELGRPRGGTSGRDRPRWRGPGRGRPAI
jgi:hypothetical protein